MKASHDPTRRTRFSTTHRRERGSTYFQQITVISPDYPPYTEGREYPEIVTVRTYGTATKNYCCMWVALPAGHGPNYPQGLYTSGSGSAGGYGYHRPSEALRAALHNAGFDLSEDISGRGDSAMVAAIAAVAAMLGVKSPIITVANF